MKVATLKALSQTAIVAGNLSIIGSLTLWFSGRLSGDIVRQNDGLFVGLWVPAFFALADRLELAALSLEEQNRYGEIQVNVNEPTVVLTSAADEPQAQSPRPLQYTQR